MGHKIGFQRSPIADIGEPVHAAGVPVVVYGFNVVAAVSGTGPSVQFYNDATGLTDIVIQCNTTADVPSTVVFPEGITFPNGCFLDAASGSDVVQVTVFYQTLS